MTVRIAILGGGPGGYVAAVRAAQCGAAVTLIERERVGGTCLNRGCIPSKIMKTTKGCAIIGASLTGHKVLTATSGPGFSLMQEALGYAVMAEIPCVVVNVQRRRDDAMDKRQYGAQRQKQGGRRPY